MEIGHGLLHLYWRRSLCLRLRLILLRRSGCSLSGFAGVMRAGRSINHRAVFYRGVGFASGNGNHQDAQQRSCQ